MIHHTFALDRVMSYKRRSRVKAQTVEKSSWGVQVTRLCPTWSPGPGTRSCLRLRANTAAGLACDQKTMMRKTAGKERQPIKKRKRRRRRGREDESTTHG